MTCKECGTSFQAKKHNAKYCHACRRKRHLENVKRFQRAYKKPDARGYNTVRSDAKSEDDGYITLACAIVKYQVDAYKTALQRYSKTGDKKISETGCAD